MRHPIREEISKDLSYLGCIQLSAHPDINNTINMCPVDFVARLVVAAALHPNSSLTVMQCTSHPRLRFNEYLGMLKSFGYHVPKVFMLVSFLLD